MPDVEGLRADLRRTYPELHAGAESVRIVRAPGRVNLIGEHTDYNEGLVLPAAIDLETWIAAIPAGDRRVELALDDGSVDGFDLDRIGAARGTWIDTVAGIAWALQEEGVPLRGLRGVVRTEIPIGSGLSSSAALQLAAAWAMASSPPPMEPMKLALAARRAENAYIGVRSGIMDQFASAHGRTDAALLLDCRSLEFRPVPLPLENHALVVCDTRSPRKLESSEYNVRRQQCEAAVEALARHEPGITSLRDVDAALLERHAGTLEQVSLKRARHVVAENDRVTATVKALESGDLGRVGELWAASHASLRDLYEVSSPELDALVEIAAGTPGVVAARMTGAGFGGCTVNLVRRGAVEALAERVATDYPARCGRSAAVHAVEPAAGAGEVAG